MIKALASLPLIGGLFGRFAEAREPAPAPAAIRKAASKHMKAGCHACMMVETLNANLKRHYAERGWTLPDDENVQYEAICETLCHQLNDWSLSEPYAEDPSVVPDVRFEAA